MIELWTLVILLLVFVAWIRYGHAEPFVGATSGTTATDHYLQACPTGFTSFYQADGTTLCCDGDIVAKRCAGHRQCVLSGGGEIPSCAAMMEEMYAEKGKDVCPAAMTTYFEGAGKMGCTDGPRNPTMTGPKAATQSTCWVYGTPEENARAKDSCANQKEMEGFPCFGKGCTKEIVSVADDKPAKIAVHFTDDTGMHRTAYTRASLRRYLDVANPKWRDQGMELEKNIGVAEVAKAYYVDHTMAQADVQV